MDGKIKGKLIEVNDVEEVGPNLTPKRDIIIGWGDGEHPSSILVTLFGSEKVDLVDKSDLFKEVTVFVNFKTTKTKDKTRTFNNINCWKVSIKEPIEEQEEDDDLPF